MEAETCKEIDIVRASISSDEELVEVHSSCISSTELCKDDGTCMSDLVVDSLDSVSYHSAVSEIERLYRGQGLQTHHVTSQLKVSDSDISSALGHHDVVCQMLAISGWGAPMSDECNDRTLSLAEVHVLKEV